MFSYVYREINGTVDSLSKEGVQLEAGVWSVSESKDEQVVEQIKSFYWLCISTAKSADISKGLDPMKSCFQPIVGIYVVLKTL